MTCLKLVALIGCICTALAVRANTVLVATVTQFNQQVALAQAGDTIQLTNGTWTNAVLVFAPVAAGTLATPIVLTAETPGSVLLTGASQLFIGGSYLVVNGLRFEGATTLVGGKDVIQFRKTTNSADHATNHCTLANCVISDYNPADPLTDYKWVTLYGTYNEIRHCFFKGKTNSGSTIVVLYNKTGLVVGDPSPSSFHWIHHNRFDDRTMPGSNDGECIRVGDSSSSFSPGFNVIEYNLFQNNLREVEVITNKSCDNIYRYNSFIGNDGHMTLRHGNRCRVEGNYFYGNTGRGFSGGIRIIGEDHVVVNNYLEELEGGTNSAIRGPIVIMDGQVGTALNGYYQVKNALVAFNTIVNCNGPGIRVGAKLSSPYAPPLSLTIANNLVYQVKGNSSPNSQAIFEDDAPIGKTYDTNVYVGTTTTMTGFTQAPATTLTQSGGLYRPGATSAAVDQGTPAYLSITTTDLEGHTRDATPDVGATEYTLAPTYRAFRLHPLNVGPTWLVALPCACSLTISAVRL